MATEPTSEIQEIPAPADALRYWIDAAQANIANPSDEGNYALYLLTQVSGLSVNDIVASLSTDTQKSVMLASLTENQAVLNQTEIHLNLNGIPSLIFENRVNAQALAGNEQFLTLAERIYDTEKGDGAWYRKVKDDIEGILSHEIPTEEYDARRHLFSISSQHGVHSEEFMNASAEYYAQFPQQMYGGRSARHREIESMLRSANASVRRAEEMLETMKASLEADSDMSAEERAEALEPYQRLLESEIAPRDRLMTQWGEAFAQPLVKNQTALKLAETLYERISKTDEFLFMAELEYDRLAAQAKAEYDLLSPEEKVERDALYDDRTRPWLSWQEHVKALGVTSGPEADALLTEWANAEIDQKMHLSKFNLDVYAEHGLDAEIFEDIDFQAKREDADMHNLANRFGRAWLQASQIVYDERNGREKGAWAAHLKSTLEGTLESTQSRREATAIQSLIDTAVEHGATSDEFLDATSEFAKTYPESSATRALLTLHTELAKEGEWAQRWHDGNWVSALRTEGVDVLGYQTEGRSDAFKAAASYLVQMDAYTRYEWRNDLAQDFAVGASDPLTVASLVGAGVVGYVSGGTASGVPITAANIARTGLIASLSAGVEGGVTERIVATSGQDSEIAIGLRSERSYDEINQRTQGGATMGAVMGLGFFGLGLGIRKAGGALLENTSVGRRLLESRAQASSAASDLDLSQSGAAARVDSTVETAEALDATTAAARPEPEAVAADVQANPSAFMAAFGRVGESLRGAADLVVERLNQPGEMRPTNMGGGADFDAALKNLGNKLFSRRNSLSKRGQAYLDELNKNSDKFGTTITELLAETPTDKTELKIKDASALLEKVLDREEQKILSDRSLRAKPRDTLLTEISARRDRLDEVRAHSLSIVEKELLDLGGTASTWHSGLNPHYRKGLYDEPKIDSSKVGDIDPNLPYRRIRKEVDVTLDKSTDPILGKDKYRSLADFQRGFTNSTANLLAEIQAAKGDPAKIKAALDKHNLTLDKMDAATDELNEPWDAGTTTPPGQRLGRDGIVLRNQTRDGYKGYKGRDDRSNYNAGVLNRPHITNIQRVAVQESVIDARQLADKLADMASKPDGAQQINEFLFDVTQRVNRPQSAPPGQFDSLIASGWTAKLKRGAPRYKGGEVFPPGHPRQGQEKGKYVIGEISVRAKNMFGYELAEGSHAFTVGERLQAPPPSPNIEHKASSKLIKIIQNLNNPNNTNVDSDFKDAAEALRDAIKNGQLSDVLYYVQRDAWMVENRGEGSVTDPFRNHPEILVKLADELRRDDGKLDAFDLGVLKRWEAEGVILGDNPELEIPQAVQNAIGVTDGTGAKMSGRAVQARQARNDRSDDLLDGRNVFDASNNSVSDAATKVISGLFSRFWYGRVRDYTVRLRDIDYDKIEAAKNENDTLWKIPFKEGDDAGGLQMNWYGIPYATLGFKPFPIPKRETMGRIANRWLSPGGFIESSMRLLPDNSRLIARVPGTRYLRNETVAKTAKIATNVAWFGGGAQMAVAGLTGISASTAAVFSPLAYALPVGGAVLGTAWNLTAGWALPTTSAGWFSGKDPASTTVSSSTTNTNDDDTATETPDLTDQRANVFMKWADSNDITPTGWLNDNKMTYFRFIVAETVKVWNEDYSSLSPNEALEPQNTDTMLAIWNKARAQVDLSNIRTEDLIIGREAAIRAELIDAYITTYNIDGDVATAKGFNFTQVFDWMIEDEGENYDLAPAPDYIGDASTADMTLPYQGWPNDDQRAALIKRMKHYETVGINERAARIKSAGDALGVYITANFPGVKLDDLPENLQKALDDSVALLVSERPGGNFYTPAQLEGSTTEARRKTVFDAILVNVNKEIEARKTALARLEAAKDGVTAWLAVNGNDAYKALTDDQKQTFIDDVAGKVANLKDTSDNFLTPDALKNPDTAVKRGSDDTTLGAIWADQLKTLDDPETIQTLQKEREEAKAARLEAAKDGLTAWLESNATDGYNALNNRGKKAFVDDIAKQTAELKDESGKPLTPDALKNPDTTVLLNDGRTRTLAEIWTGAVGELSTPEGRKKYERGGIASPIGPDADLSLTWAEAKQSTANWFNVMTDHDGDGAGFFVDTNIGRSISGGVQSAWRAASGAYKNSSQTRQGKEIWNGVFAFGGALFAPWALSKLPGFGWLNARGVRTVVIFAAFFLGWKALNSGAFTNKGSSDSTGSDRQRNDTDRPNTVERRWPDGTVTDAVHTRDETEGSGDETAQGSGQFAIAAKSVPGVKIQNHEGGMPKVMEFDFDEDGNIDLTLRDDDKDGVFVAQVADVNSADNYVLPEMINSNNFSSSTKFAPTSSGFEVSDATTGQEISIEIIDEAGQQKRSVFTVNGNAFELPIVPEADIDAKVAEMETVNHGLT